MNAGIAERLKNFSEKDAGLSAIGNLDDLAMLVPIVINETLSEMEDSFSSYLNE